MNLMFQLLDSCCETAQELMECSANLVVKNLIVRQSKRHDLWCHFNISFLQCLILIKPISRSVIAVLIIISHKSFEHVQWLCPKISGSMTQKLKLNRVIVRNNETCLLTLLFHI